MTRQRPMFLLVIFALAFGCPAPAGPRVPESELGGDDDPAPLTPAACAALPHEPSQSGCKWTVGTSFYCAAKSATPEEEAPQPTCICNGCLVDADCGAGGRCLEFPAYGCLSSARVCVRPGDPCFEKKSCGFSCLHDASGRVFCLPRYAGP